MPYIAAYPCNTADECPEWFDFVDWTKFLPYANCPGQWLTKCAVQQHSIQSKSRQIAPLPTLRVSLLRERERERERERDCCIEAVVVELPSALNYYSPFECIPCQDLSKCWRVREESIAALKVL
jgi:hypothetical protein